MTSSEERRKRLKKALEESQNSSSRVKQLAETGRLSSQLDRQRARIEGFGVNAPRAQSPSMLGRVLDVISRPSFSVNEGIRRGAEAIRSGEGIRSIDDFLEGAGSGITGKSKTIFEDVLREAGMAGGWQRSALGFSGDVFLDPTTYIGVGVAGKADDVAKAATKAENAVQKAFKAREVATRGVRSAQKRAITAQMTAAARAAGKPIPAKRIAAAVAAVDDDLLDWGVAEARKETVEAMKKASPKMELRIAGKKVAASPRAYGSIAKVGEIIGRTPGLAPVVKGMSTARAFPGGVHTIKNIHEAQNAIHLREGLKELQRTFKGTKRAQREELYEYITHGTLHPDPQMQDLITKTRAVLDDIAHSEIHELGNVKLVPSPTYMPTVYKKGGHLRKFSDPLDAEKAGYKQVKDVATLLGWKTMRHQREMSKLNMAGQIVREFGVDVNKSKLGAKMAERNLLTNNVGGLAHVPKDVYFDRDIAEGLRRLTTTINNDEEMKAIASTFDKVQSTWKFLVTAPSPGFHTRNLMGDFWNNWLDGVQDPRAYAKAARVIANDRLGPVSLRLSKNLKIDASDIRRLYDGQGLRSGFIAAEANLVPSALHSAARKPGEAIRHFSESREDFGRMAHFMDALQKEFKNAPTGVHGMERAEWAAERAANRVRKFNFDYNDFTQFEKTKLRRAIPFYSWMRKNLPLQLEMLMMRPGRMALAPKGMRAISSLTGVDPDDEPMVGLDNVIPQWIIDSAMPMIQQGNSEQDPKFLNLRLPYGDIGDYTEGLDEFAGDLGKGDFNWNALTEGPGRTMLSQLTPFARVPFEMVQGNQMFSGAPIEDPNQYLLQQFGFLGRTASNRMEPRPPEKRGGVVEINVAGRKIRVPENVFSSLVGWSPRAVTPQMMKGELRRQQDPLQTIIAEAKKRAVGG